MTRRELTAGCCAMLLLGLTGCMATESQQGDLFVYKKSILNIVGLLAIAIALIVFGTGIAFENARAAIPKKKRSRKRRSRSTQSNRPALGKSVAGVLIGTCLFCGGALILGLGVPSSFVQHITISNESVTTRLSVLWMNGQDQVIPFSSISSIQRVETGVARRGHKKERLIINSAVGTQNIEMGPLERAAYPKLMEMFTAYQNSNISVTEPPPLKGELLTGKLASLEESQETDSTTTGAQPTAGVNPISPDDTPPTTTNNPSNPVVDVTPKPQTQPKTPESKPPTQHKASELRSLKRGTKLQAQWANRWLPVTVIRENSDGTVQVHWDGYSNNFDEALPKSRLRKAPVPTGAILGRIRPGDKLEAKWANRWLPVTVKRERPGGTVEIHWDGYSSNFDEAVPKSRLRRPTKQ